MTETRAAAYNDGHGRLPAARWGGGSRSDHANMFGPLQTASALATALDWAALHHPTARGGVLWFCHWWGGARVLTMSTCLVPANRFGPANRPGLGRSAPPYGRGDGHYFGIFGLRCQVWRRGADITRTKAIGRLAVLDRCRETSRFCRVLEFAPKQFDFRRIGRGGRPLWAAAEARATVILCESEVSPDRDLGKELAGWLTIDPVAIARESSPGGMTGLPLMPTDQERERESQKDLVLRILYGSLMSAPADMSASSNSLSQLTGSGSSAAALAGSVFSLSPPPLVGRVPPEALPRVPGRSATGTPPACLGRTGSPLCGFRNAANRLWFVFLEENLK